MLAGVMTNFGLVFKAKGLENNSDCSLTDFKNYSHFIRERYIETMQSSAFKVLNTFLIFIFKINFIGLQLLYHSVLVSTVHLSESAVHPCFWSSFPFKSLQNPEQSSWSYTVGSHQLPFLYILYMVSIVYVCQSQSPNVILSLFPLGSFPGINDSFSHFQ